MPTKNRILIAGGSFEALQSMESLLADARDLAVETQLLNGHGDPLRAGAALPELLVLHVGGDSTAELEALAERPAAERPPLIVVGAANHAAGMRAAMRAGARDFLPEPVSQQELLAAIGRVTAEHGTSRGTAKSVTTAVINAKGGSGATFLACNLAHLFVELSDMKTVLMDLDLQYGALPRYLDLKPKRSLLEALDVASDLDATSIDAYVTKHDSGLAVMAGPADSTMLQQELMADRFEAVLALLSSAFERLVIDVPRHVEPFGAIVLERANQIVLMVQQSVPSLHDATCLYEFLTRTLAIAPERISIVVNRFHKAAAVELSDIEHSFDGCRLLCIPNDFRAVADSINVGVPIYEYARRSPVTKALLRLEKQLGGRGIDASGKGFLPLLRRAG